MQIIARRTLKAFWESHPKSAAPLTLCYAKVLRADWKSPADIKDMFGATVDFVGDNRVFFDIGGNNYRLVVHVAYAYRKVLIKFVGTHKDYDKIDAEAV